jgi:hypothetical protein
MPTGNSFGRGVWCHPRAQQQVDDQLDFVGLLGRQITATPLAQSGHRQQQLLLLSVVATKLRCP